MLIDCPADRAGISQRRCRGAKAVVVTTPEVSAVRDADRIIGLMEAGNCAIFA